MMRIEIRNSRRKTIRYLTFSLVFTVAGILGIVAIAFSADVAAPAAARMIGNGMLIFLAIGSLFFGIAAAMLVWLLFDRRPRIVLDDEGVFASNLYVDRIAWSDICDAHVYCLYGNNLVILLKLADEGKYLARLSPARRAVVLKTSAALGIPPFGLTLSGLDVSADELLQAVLMMAHDAATRT